MVKGEVTLAGHDLTLFQFNLMPQREYLRGSFHSMRGKIISGKEMFCETTLSRKAQMMVRTMETVTTIVQCQLQEVS